MEEIDIVSLIENNPVTKLSKDYNVKLLVKIKETFSDFEQQLFLSSFYCYLNYDKNIDFVVDLDDIWKWLGFSQKVNVKRIIEKQFIVNVDYKILNDNKKSHGGHNKETILLKKLITVIINDFSNFNQVFAQRRILI
jgi:hypothetical protein